MCESKAQCELEHLDLLELKDLPEIEAGPRAAATFMKKIQYSRTAPISWESMAIALSNYLITLPQAVIDQLLLVLGNHGSTTFTTQWGNDAWYTECRRRMKHQISSFHIREYVIWPFQMEQHWMAAVLHMTTEDAADANNFVRAPQPNTVAQKDPTARTHVDQIAIIDPLKDQDASVRIALVRTQLLTILNEICNFSYTGTPDVYRDVWVPAQPVAGDNSDGPRVYSICKETMRRVLDIYEAQTGFHESLWNDHSGWFHEDSVRHSMIADHAWMTIDGMKGYGRLAVEAIKCVRPNKQAKWEDAGPQMLPLPATYPPREPERPENPRVVPLRNPDDPTQASQQEPRRRPLFALPPRGQPRVHPTFSMYRGDGFNDYNGWIRGRGRRDTWDDPLKRWPRPPPPPPPDLRRSHGRARPPTPPQSGSLF